MGTRLQLELIISDAAMAAAKEHQVNLPEVACNAIIQELLMKQQISDHCTDMSPSMENRALRELLTETLSELEMSRKEIRENLLHKSVPRDTVWRRAQMPAIDAHDGTVPEMRLSTPAIRIFK